MGKGEALSRPPMMWPLSLLLRLLPFANATTLPIGTQHQHQHIVRPRWARTTPATLEGVWSVHGRSESLSPFLRACGVPRLVAPLMAKLFNDDMTEIRRAPATSPSVRISVRRNGWSLPVQLQTD